MMKTQTKLTWTGDLRAALGAVVHGLGRGSLDFNPAYFNDRHKTCRRIKFTYRSDLTDSDLELMQQVIQERRPELNVTVARKESDWFGNYLVYYRPKVGTYMNH